MLKIRLQRGGKKQKPTYSIVVAEHSIPVSGRYLEKLGFYDPNKSPKELSINADSYSNWMQEGAKPSETVARLFERRESFENPKQEA